LYKVATAKLLLCTILYKTWKMCVFFTEFITGSKVLVASDFFLHTLTRVCGWNVWQILTNPRCYFSAVNLRRLQHVTVFDSEALQGVRYIHMWLERNFYNPYSELNSISLFSLWKELLQKNLADVCVFTLVGVIFLTSCIYDTTWWKLRKERYIWLGTNVYTKSHHSLRWWGVNFTFRCVGFPRIDCVL
jgi:hypothetical protein